MPEERGQDQLDKTILIRVPVSLKLKIEALVNQHRAHTNRVDSPRNLFEQQAENRRDKFEQQAENRRDKFEQQSKRQRDEFEQQTVIDRQKFITHAAMTRDEFEQQMQVRTDDQGSLDTSKNQFELQTDLANTANLDAAITLLEEALALVSDTNAAIKQKIHEALKLLKH